MKLLVATNNAGKVKEFAELLADIPLKLIGLSNMKGVTDVAETGETFEENAVLKARGYALQAGVWAMADDSGLEIEALDGRPGVHSARYGGEDTSYTQKMEFLLGELAATGDLERRARFACSLAIANEEGEVLCLASGTVEGRIAPSPRGLNGFGYDPIFVPNGYDETIGELSNDVKQHISHRARASAEIIRFLRDFTGT